MHAVVFLFPFPLKSSTIHFVGPSTAFRSASKGKRSSHSEGRSVHYLVARLVLLFCTNGRKVRKKTAFSKIYAQVAVVLRQGLSEIRVSPKRWLHGELTKTRAATSPITVGSSGSEALARGGGSARETYGRERRE